MRFIRSQEPKIPCKCKTLKCSSMCADKIEYRCDCNSTFYYFKVLNWLVKKHHNELLDNLIHKNYYSFLRKFGDKEKFLKYKHVGYDFMQRAERFAKKNKRISIISCDDNYHAGSDLVVIPHEDRFEVWGWTVVYIPQCTGESPIEFFLYPDHLKEFLEVMKGEYKRYLHKKRNGLKKKTVFDYFPKFVKKNNKNRR